MSHRASFTLVEALVSVSVVLVLVAIVVKVWPYAEERSEGAKCMQNMRSLYVSLSGYIQDHGHWPQEPEGVAPDALEDWWIAELKPYGATDKVWRCPTIWRRISDKTPGNRPKIHYMPGIFDDAPYSPFRWPTQPWLSEIGNMHGRGALLCFPDGSIRAMDDIR